MTRSGRTVLITGASSGIGLASAHRLIDRGWRVFAAARRLERMESLRGGGAEVLPLDIASGFPVVADAITSQVEGLMRLSIMRDSAMSGLWNHVSGSGSRHV